MLPKVLDLLPKDKGLNWLDTFDTMEETWLKEQGVPMLFLNY